MTILAHAPGSRVHLARAERQPLHIVLVADGSPNAAAGAQTLQVLALPPGSELTFLTKEVSSPRPGAPAAEALPPVADLVRREGLAVTSHVVPDVSARYLREYSAARPVDLVVVGIDEPAATMTGLLREALSPWVEQLPMPVLVARAPFTGLSRILLAYDGSPDSDAAVEYLTRLPLPVGTTVTVLNVLTDVPMIEAVPAAGPEAPRMARAASVLELRDQPHAEHLHLAHKQVERALQVLAGAGLAAHGQVLWGEAAAAILHQADAINADLIVAGSRGLSGVWSWLLGSVSRQLARDRRRPLLIVRGEIPAGQAPPEVPGDLPAT